MTLKDFEVGTEMDNRKKRTEISQPIGTVESSSTAHVSSTV